MPRRVNFTSFSDDGGLPDITKGHNWVNDNPRRFHSEPRRVRGNTNNGGTFPTPSQNGYLVSKAGVNGAPRNGVHGGYEGYSQPRDGRRLQSLPPTKPKADEVDHRQIKSAPSNEVTKRLEAGPVRGYRDVGAHVPPRSRVADNDAGIDIHQRTHGKATRAYEVKYLRSNKFASSWAQVRADNPDFNLSPHHSPAKGPSNDHQSPDSMTRTQSTRDSSPSNHDEIRKDQKKVTQKKHRGRPNHKTRGGAKSRFEDENNNGGSPGRNHASGNESEAIDDEENGSPNSDKRERKVSKKREWNDSVVIPQCDKPPPKISLRYLDSLTFKPKVNTGKDVFHTYVSQDKKPVRELENEHNLNFSENEEGYESSANESYLSGDESNDNSQERQKKEKFLNRREARKYIKMTNVYGSEAYKNQRKEWFLQKIAEVQEAKAKYKVEQNREEKNKRKEDMKRQQRQLNHVRKKFRTEQEHRFRTQYVTARVLEYEQVNRHMYGLPEDFLDLAYLLNNDGDPTEETPKAKDESENKENRLLAQDKNKNKNSKPTNNTSPARTGKKKAKSPEKNTEKKKKEEKDLAKARENQKSWYAKSEPDSISPSPDTRSHASHATSGYESEKGLTDQNKNLLHSEDNYTTQHKDVIKRDLHNPDTKPSSDSKQKGLNVHKRLESQKGIYTRPNVARNKQQNLHQGNGVKKDSNADLGNVGNKSSNQHSINHVARPDNNTKPNHSKTDKVTPGSDQRLNPKDESITTDSTLPQSGQTHIKLGSTAFTDSKLTSLDKTENDPGTENRKGVAINLEETLTPNKSKPNQFNSMKNKQAEQGPADKESNKEAITGGGISRSMVTNGHTIADNDKMLKAAKPGTSSKGEETGDFKLGAKTIHPGRENPTTGNTGKKGFFNGNNSTADKKGDQTNTIDKNKSKQTGDNVMTSTSKNSPVIKVEDEMEKQHPVSNTDSTTAKARPSELSETHKTQYTPSVLTQKPPVKYSPIKDNQRTGQFKDKVVSEHHTKPPATSSTKAGVHTISSPGDQPGNKQHGNKQHSSGLSNPQRVAFDDMPRQPHTDSAKSQTAGHQPPKRKESLADRMFNIKTGPTWDPHKKTPKMEGIDTVVVNAKDKKGRNVKRKKKVKDVVKEADNLLKVPHTDNFDKKSGPGQGRSRAVSPDLTLGSDFDVDDDDELMEEDIFERLRRKYNIAIDSDEEHLN